MDDNDRLAFGMIIIPNLIVFLIFVIILGLL